MVLLTLVASAVGGCQAQFQPATLVDDFGREIKIERVPERIISHVPGSTEILFALGLEEKVVGVSTYCNYPPEAELKAKVGDFWSPSIESIVALEPDVVFTMGSNQLLMTELDTLGISYIVLQPKDIDGVLRNIELVGKVTDTEKQAEKLLDEMQERIFSVVSRVKDAPRPKVFYTFATTDLNNPWTAGPGSFIDSMITLAGGENIGAKASASWAQFSIEEVLNSDPEVIIVDASMGSAVTSIDELKQHPAWQEISAIKQGRIHPVDGDLINRYGPRIVQGLEEMAKSIHPELFQ